MHPILDPFYVSAAAFCCLGRGDLEGNFSQEEQDPYTYTEAIHVKKKRKREKRKEKKKLETVLSRAGVDIHSLFISLSHLACVIWLFIVFELNEGMMEKLRITSHQCAQISAYHKKF
jgi:hypothetical protein